jgi:hypothetical protein
LFVFVAVAITLFMIDAERFPPINFGSKGGTDIDVAGSGKFGIGAALVPGTT